MVPYACLCNRVLNLMILYLDLVSFYSNLLRKIIPCLKSLNPFQVFPVLYIFCLFFLELCIISSWNMLLTFFKNNFHNITNHFLQVMKLYRIFLGRGIQKIPMFHSRGEWEKLLNGRLRVMKKVLMNPNVSFCSPTYISHICQIFKLNIVLLYWLTLLHTCISTSPIPYIICSAIIAYTLYYRLSDDFFCCTIFFGCRRRGFDCLMVMGIYFHIFTLFCVYNS